MILFMIMILSHPRIYRWGGMFHILDHLAKASKPSIAPCGTAPFSVTIDETWFPIFTGYFRSHKKLANHRRRDGCTHQDRVVNFIKRLREILKHCLNTFPPIEGFGLVVD